MLPPYGATKWYERCSSVSRLSVQMKTFCVCACATCEAPCQLHDFVDGRQVGCGRRCIGGPNVCDAYSREISHPNLQGARCPNITESGRVPYQQRNPVYHGHREYRPGEVGVHRTAPWTRGCHAHKCNSRYRCCLLAPAHVAAALFNMKSNGVRLGASETSVSCKCHVVHMRTWFQFCTRWTKR